VAGCCEYSNKTSGFIKGELSIKKDPAPWSQSFSQVIQCVRYKLHLP
jgi:hypothetical protein